MDQIRRVPPAPPPRGGVGRRPTSADLLRACGKGDEAAFAQLYDATRSRVVGLAVRVVRDPAQAEEVAQEAFLEIWRNSGRFDPARAARSGWLLTIVHRKAVDRVRSAEASSRRDTTYHQQNQPVEHDSTAEAAQASLEARRVRQALVSLTPVQREALELAYFGGYTHTEVATMLELPVGTAKTRIRDGLIRLRDTMGVPRDQRHPRSVGGLCRRRARRRRAGPVRAHLAGCQACRHEVDSLREAAALLPETTAAAPSPGLRDRVLADIASVRPLPPPVGDGHRARAPPAPSRHAVSRGRCGGRRDRDRGDRLAADERRRAAQRAPSR